MVNPAGMCGFSAMCKGKERLRADQPVHCNRFWLIFNTFPSQGFSNKGPFIFYGVGGAGGIW